MISTKNVEILFGEMTHHFTSRKLNISNKLTHRKPLYKHSMN